MVVVSEKLHAKRLKENNLVIEEVYKYTYEDTGEIYVRRSDGKRNDSVYSAKKIEKNYFYKNSLIYKETDFDQNVDYTLINNESNKEITCSMCGHKDNNNSFYDGCPYCGSNFNIDYKGKRLGGNYKNKKDNSLDRYLKHPIVKTINIGIPLGFSLLYLIYHIFNKFLFLDIVVAASLFASLWGIIYFIFLCIFVPYDLYKAYTSSDYFSNDLHNDILRIDGEDINNNKIINDLHFELLNYYYDSKLCPKLKNLIDFEIIEYENYKLGKENNNIYIDIKYKVRKYYFINEKIRKRVLFETIRLIKNKNIIINTSENIEKCIGCGASIDLSRKECSYCGARIPSPNEWIMDYRYIK